MEKVLIVPGLHNSGPGHWQTWFESQVPHSLRVEQQDWERPVLADWARQVEEAIEAAGQPVWIVAHSFGCLASVAASFAHPAAIQGAFLVAPADPDRFGLPHALLEHPLPFPSLVVASSNDPWVSAQSARHWAGQWGSEHLNIGQAGHINLDSGHGPWPQGLALFEAFRERIRARLPASAAPAA